MKLALDWLWGWGWAWGFGDGLGWAGLGWELVAGLAVGWLAWAGLGWVGNLETEIGVFEIETEIGLFENGMVCLHRKNELPDGQQQQAITIYFFLEG